MFSFRFTSSVCKNKETILFICTGWAKNEASNSCSYLQNFDGFYIFIFQFIAHVNIDYFIAEVYAVSVETVVTVMSVESSC